ncbi:hypothetical protein [Undibacterium sp. TJN19]|uniref:hypothetical protein n=1 Tax=Undibacterium sp. TJN19 TaxID=3413055 RepID=UPI003BF3D142
MNLAMATPDDFRRMWSIFRTRERLRYAYLQEDQRTRESRCAALILGRLDQLGGGFLRVVHGAEILIDACCVKFVDVYKLKPEIATSDETLAALKEMVNEVQPLGIDRPVYQAALAAIEKAERS